MTERVHVGKRADFPPGEVRLVQVGARPLALFHVGGALCAIDDRCPHRAGPLSEGKRTGNEITCPWHGSRFDLTDGRRLDGPAARGLTCFSVEVEGEDVWVTLSPR